MTPLPGAIDIAAALISVEEPFQVRVNGLDEDHVEALVAEYEADPCSLPPAVLARRETAEGPIYYIVDGHHEVEAITRAGRDRVNAVVLDNLTDEQAIDLAWERNRQNSKNLSFDDRMAHAQRLQQRQPRLSDAEIAQICGISRSTAWRLSNNVSRKQREPANPVVAYLRRLALAPVEWASPKDAAAEVRAAISDDVLDSFAQRLGDSALAALDVAEELGFSH
jgi:hypothetical protein